MVAHAIFPQPLFQAGPGPLGDRLRTVLAPSQDWESVRPCRFWPKSLRAGVVPSTFPFHGIPMYTKKLYAGWADMDFNSHMKNTAYLDKAADVRQKFLIEHGFPMEEFLRLRIGPVVMKDE